MVTQVVLCPHCHQAEPVIRHGTNRGGTARCRCKACDKTFTPEPNPRRTSEETKAAVERALAERLSQRAIARACRVGDKTVRQVARDAQKNSKASPKRR